MPSRLWAIAGAAVILGVALFLHTLLASEAWQNRQRVRADLEDLRTRNAMNQTRVEVLRSQIDALRSRREVQERVVRQELGYVREGEIVLELSHAAPRAN